MSHRLIIIGAGVSGIAAATRLVENGFNDFLILEAENRIGGRIFSSFIGEHSIDLGAQWCHGEKNNLVYEKANPLNLLKKSNIDFEEDSIFFDSNGSELNENDYELLKLIYKISEIDESQVESPEQMNGSYGSFVVQLVNEALEKDDLKHLSRDNLKTLIDWTEKSFCGYNASDSWYRTSVRDQFMFEKTQGDQLLCWGQQTYSTLFDILLKKMPNVADEIKLDDKLLLNKHVKKIDYQNDHAQSYCTIECDDSSRYQTDCVLVTVPLGVLKSNQIQFVPGLPQYKLNAINGLDFGTVDKLFFEFPHKWWPNDQKSFCFLIKDDEKVAFLENFDGDKVSIKTKNLISILEMKHFFSETSVILPQQKTNEWLLDVYCFHEIAFRPNCLMGWIFGKSAKVMETIDEQQVRDKLYQFLNIFLGNKYQIPQPIHFIRSKWYTNRNFHGSYSLRSVSTEEMNTSACELARPVGNQVKDDLLLFAGEATHDRFYSTVHGAIGSGYREADRFLINIKKQQVNNIEAKQIVIIGAGVAGLGCAKKLLDSNFHDFVVLEAQNYIGGRIKTDYLCDDDGFVELGAQWLHESNSKLFDDFKDLFQVSNSVEEVKGIFIRDDGYIFDKHVVDQVDFIVGHILYECELFFKENLENCPRSIGEYLSNSFNDYLEKCVDDSNELKQLKRQLFNWHWRFQVIDNSCICLNDVSAKYWGTYQITDNNQYHLTVRNGYSNLIDHLTRHLNDQQIKLNSVVEEINWKENKVRLKLRNNKMYECDCVIVTTSIGYLKSNLNMFKPNLPKKFEEMIMRIGFYVINKIFLIFDKKWWDVDGFQIVWNNDDDDDDDNFVPNWLKSISGFDSIETNEGGKLLGWIGGVGAEIVEEISEDILGIECAKFFRRILNDDTIPNPKQVIRTKWKSNEFTKGAYSFISNQCDPFNSNILNEIIFNENERPIIAFAGEAVHSTKYSTVHGAYESAIQQTQKVLNYFSK